VKRELELLQEISRANKAKSQKEAEMETLQYKAVLDREVELNNNQGEIKLTPEQESMRILAQVINSRRNKAEAILDKKNGNTFYQ
jgi:hypothetical protein